MEFFLLKQKVLERSCGGLQEETHHNCHRKGKYSHYVGLFSLVSFKVIREDEIVEDNSPKGAPTEYDRIRSL